MRLFKLLGVTCLIFIAGCRGAVAPPAIAAAWDPRFPITNEPAYGGEPALPVPDATVQRWLESLTDGVVSEHRGFFPILRELLEAKAKHKLTDEAWLTQTLLFVCRPNDGERVQRAYIFLSFSRIPMDISTEAWINALTPYMVSTDPRVARNASGMIWISGIFIPDRSGGDLLWPVGFSSIEGYLGGLSQADPSWPLMRMMYEVDPDAALRTTCRVYLTGETLWAAERAQRELRIQLLSLFQAISQRPQRDELLERDSNQKIVATLGELANHPHWCVRAYALEIISKGLSQLTRYADWPRDTTVPERLATDSNPYISQFASEILARIKAANSAK